MRRSAEGILRVCACGSDFGQLYNGKRRAGHNLHRCCDCGGSVKMGAVDCVRKRIVCIGDKCRKRLGFLRNMHGFQL